MPTKRRFKTIGLGGTFDHFHDGHKHFLNFASSLGRSLTIGITNPKLTLHKPFAETVEPFKKRFQAVKSYCKAQRWQFKLVQLDDIYGPTITDSSIKALAVTPDTTLGADMINQTRDKLKLPQLPIYICNLLKDETDRIINSTRIRSGDVSRNGLVYKQILAKNINLNQKQRLFFQKAQGEIIKKPEKNQQPFTAVVGDTSLELFIHKGWQYNLGVFDGKKQRQPVHSATLEKLTVQQKASNPTGTLSSQLSSSLQDCLANQNKHLFVEGEEDLAAVALVLLLPLESHIYYGQPNDGIVCMKVTEKLKSKVSQVLHN